MQRDFAPVHVTAAFCTLHEPHDHRRCVDNTRGGALQACCTRQLVTHARAMHCSRLAVASVTRSAGLLACPATCTRRCQLHNSFSRAGHPDVQRVVDEEADLGCKSTPELACDAVTPGTLSAGVLGRFEELAHLLCTCSSAASQRDLLKCSLEFLSCSATFEFSARK